MEIKLASEHLMFPRELSLQQMAKHSIAKYFWGEFEFILKQTDYDREFSIAFFAGNLISHGKAVLDNVFRTFSTCLPEKLMNGVLHAVIDLREGYRKAIIWEEKYQCALTFTILNSLTAGSYAAGYFITPGGHFDDLSWAKMFVTDTKQGMQERFQLACFYCFEDEILHLWHTMKSNKQLPCQGKLGQIKTKFGYLVGLWAYQLENKIYELIDENDSFLVCGFRKAIDGHHEHAARFFWARCSDIEKRNCLQDIDLYVLCRAANDDAEFTFFIYSLLPVEKKNSLVLRSMEEEFIDTKVPRIWCCLLQSQFWEPVLKDILTFPYPIPSHMYICLFNSLIANLRFLQIPIHKAIVKVLWNKVSQMQDEIFPKSLHMIKELAKIKAIDLLETIIQTSGHSVKERLLKRYPFVAIRPLFEFSVADNYDAVLRYLLSFLIGRSHVNQKLTLRVDAFKVIDYIEKQFFKFRMKQVPEPKKNEVKVVIECVQGSLQVLDQLLGKAEEMENG